MTTALSENGAVILPAVIREQLKLAPGDDLEINLEDGETITLRRAATTGEKLRSSDRAERIAAMDAFLDEWAGAFELPSAEEIAKDPRLASLIEKHVK
jgi:AbrB family looped-hinge helix DNA binding protein